MPKALERVPFWQWMQSCDVRSFEEGTAGFVLVNNGTLTFFRLHRDAGQTGENRNIAREGMFSGARDILN
jgi:hypothetical protein